MIGSTDKTTGKELFFGMYSDGKEGGSEGKEYTKEGKERGSKDGRERLFVFPINSNDGNQIDYQF